MGWCSGTRIFDAVAGYIIPPEQDQDMELDDRDMKLLEVIADVLWDGDWDCEADSDFADHPQIKKLLKLEYDEEDE